MHIYSKKLTDRRNANKSEERTKSKKTSRTFGAFAYASSPYFETTLADH